MDQFMAMRAFVEAVKGRSLTNAAYTLGASRALISRQISALENDLAVRLMHRTTRSIALTEAGEKYFHFCDTILTQIDEMGKEIQNETRAAEGVLTILVPMWLGSSAAARIASAFAAQYPAIRPKLILGGMSPTAYDFLEQGCDIALHTRPLPDSRILAKKVTSIPFVLCASATYLDSAAPISSPQDLTRHHALVQYNHPVWTLLQGEKEQKVRFETVLSANSYLALHTAVLTGLGVTILPRAVGGPDIESGRLVRILPDWEIEAHSLYVATAPGGGAPAKVRLFVDFISEWFKANPL